jgi:hypothetical protein
MKTVLNSFLGDVASPYCGHKVYTIKQVNFRYIIKTFITTFNEILNSLLFLDRGVLQPFGLITCGER